LFQAIPETEVVSPNPVPSKSTDTILGDEVGKTDSKSRVNLQGSQSNVSQAEFSRVQVAPPCVNSHDTTMSSDMSKHVVLEPLVQTTKAQSTPSMLPTSSCQGARSTAGTSLPEATQPTHNKPAASRAGNHTQVPQQMYFECCHILQLAFFT